MRDSGIGIAADELPRIFDRFHRVENAAGRSHEGSGIGLSLVRELVALNGGTVDVESAEAAGTTFTVRVPFGTAHLPADRVVSTDPALASTATRADAYVEEALRWLPAGELQPVQETVRPGDRGRRILVVDDNADMREYLRQILQRSYVVTTARDGRQALAAVAESAPDLVLADVMMPRLDGFGLLEALRSQDRTRELPVILLSARAGDEAKIEGLEAGADDYLVKPFGARELTARIAATLELAQTRQRLDALRASEEKYRTLFETMIEGFVTVEVVYDDAGRPVDALYLEGNPSASRLTGVPDYSRRLLSEVMPSAEPFWLEIYDRVARTGVAEHLERYAEAHEQWYDFSVSPIVEEDGPTEPRRLSILFQDITARKRAEEALRASEERQHFLLALGDALRARTGASEKIDIAARLLGEKLRASRILFTEYDWPRNIAHTFGGWIADDAQPFVTIQHLEDYDGQTLNELKVGRTVRVDDVGALAGEPGFFAIAELGVQALLSPPLMIDGRLAMNLSVHQDRPRRWTDDEVALVQEVAERLWAEVVRARSEAALRESEERQAFLLRLSDATRELIEPVEIQTVALRLLAEHLDLSRAAYSEIQSDHDRAVRVATYDRDLPPVPRNVRISDFSAEQLACYLEGRPFVVSDTETDERVAATREACRAIRVRAWIGIPVVKNGRLLTVLGVEKMVPHAWTDAEIELVQEVTRRTWDASERGYVEGALRQSEERYRELFERIDEGFCVIEMIFDGDDPVDYRFLTVNPVFERQTGIAQAEGRLMREIAPDHEQHWFDIFGRIARSGEPERFIQRAEALGFWYDVYAFRTGDPGEGKVGILFQDISERVRQEAALQSATELLRASQERQAFLLKLSDAFRANPDEAAIRQACVDALAQHIGADRCYIAELAAERDEAVVTAEYRSADSASILGIHTISNYADAFRLFREGRPFVSRDVRSDPDLSERDRAAIADDLGIEAIISAPLGRGQENIIWALTVGAGSPREWSREELHLVQDVAERSWAAIERARGEARLREHQEHQAFLLALSDALSTLSTSRELVDVAISRLCDRLQVNRVFYGKIEDDRLRVLQNHVRGVRSIVGEQSLEAFGLEFLANYRAGSVVVSDDVVRDPRLTEGAREGLRDREVAAFADAILFEASDEICLLAVQSASPRIWSAIDQALVRAVGDRLMSALKRAKAENALRASEADLEAELQRANLLRALSARLVTEESLPAIYDEILNAAIAITEADAGTVQVYDPATATLVLLVTRGFRADMIDHFHRVDAGSNTACGAALRTGTREFVDFDHDHSDEACRMHVAAGIRSAQATPLLSRDGSPIGMINTHWKDPQHRATADQLRFLDLLARQAADLIEQRRADAALRDSEERLRRFGEASQDILWIRDAETLQWNYLTPAFETIYGLSRVEALEGDNYRSWLDLIVPADRALAMESITRVRAGEHVTFDYRIQRPDGAIRWLRNTDFPIVDAHGEVILVGGIGHDLTELREAQLRLQTLIEGIPQLVWRAIDSGIWTWASPQWTAYTGQRDADSHGWGWLDALHPDDRPAAREAWANAIESGGFEVECRICRATEQEYRWFQTRATPVRDEKGDIIEWLGTSTDIHDMRVLQERQMVLVAELQHRTRNLMGVVRSTAERTGEASTDFFDFRHRFRDRLEALARVQGLLSRLGETDRVAFDELIATELAAMDGAVDRVSLHGPKGIKMRSTMVQTLAMALHELATNAVKYGALGQPGGHLSISWRMVAPDRRGRPRLHIDWRETGVAMPPAGAAPQGGGQGRELIEKALPYQLSAETKFELGPDGVHCTITIPVSERNATEKKYG